MHRIRCRSNRGCNLRLHAQSLVVVLGLRMNLRSILIPRVLCLSSALDARIGTCCPYPNHRHLIADNLGWFTETKDEPRTVEEIVRAKGGRVRIGTLHNDGETIEIESDSDDPTSSTKTS